MKIESAQPSAAFRASVQPVVLVGGRSVRFGRDKLREPWGTSGQVLVQRPIESLRAVFGNRVRLVGACDPSIHSLADGMIVDRHPGVGPLGGIVSALLACAGPVLVLAGDMPRFGADDVRRLLMEAEQSPDAMAVFAEADRIHPCAGLYRHEAMEILAARIARGAYAAVPALDGYPTVRVRVDPAAAANVNRPEDL